MAAVVAETPADERPPRANTSPPRPPTRKAPFTPGGRRPLRALGDLFQTLLGLLALAPPALAFAVAAWAIATDSGALLRIGWLLWRHTPYSMPRGLGASLITLDQASRVGMLALAYLSLCLALIPLLAGLLGRGWARLFALPGALLVASALVFLGVGVALCAPLLAHTRLPRWGEYALLGYLALAAFTLGAALLDTRGMRGRRGRRGVGRRRQRRGVRRQARQAAAISPPAEPAPPALPA